MSNNQLRQLSQAQQRIVALEEYYGDKAINNIAALSWLGQHIDTVMANKAINMVIAAYDSLRLHIINNSNGYAQYISDFVWQIIPQKEFAGRLGEDGIDNWLQIESVRPFQFFNQQLFEFILVRDKVNDEWGVYLKIHHIISDGWTMQMMFSAINRLYRGLVKGENEEDLFAEVFRDNNSYFGYLDYENAYINSPFYQQDKQLWLDYLRPLPAGFSLFDRWAEKNTAEIKRKIFALSDDLRSDISRFAKQNRVTPFLVMLSALAVHCTRISGNDDIVIGTFYHGRQEQWLRKVAGMMVSLLPVKMHCAGGRMFSELLREVRDMLRTMQKEWQRVPYNHLEQEFAGQKLLSNISLIQLPPSQINVQGVAPAADPCGITICIDPNNREKDRILELAVDYQTALYNLEEIDTFMQRWLATLIDIVHSADKRLSQIALCDKKEYDRVRWQFNDTKRDYPEDETIFDLLQGVNTRYGDNAALCYKNRELSFCQLDQLTTFLAKKMLSAGLQPENIVAILSQRGLEMIPVALAAMKAGGAYLPIDPNYPDERIHYLLSDSMAPILFCQRALRDKIGDYSGQIFFIEDIMPEWESGAGIFAAHDLPEISPSQLAYMIYTSGSTGNPKGVMIEHGNLYNICRWHHEYHSITAADNTAFYSGFGFDASVWEIFPFLTAGVCVHVIADDIRLSPLAVNEYFNEHNITVANLPTQFCEQFMNLCDNHSLRRLVTGGDKLNSFRPQRYAVINEYGPTEYTISATAFTVDKFYENIPIGKPLANSEAYIVDKYHQILPIGMAGELCLAGRQLARGYWQRPELTAEKFVDNPFNFGSRMYLTGDKVRWLPNGNIEFIGRTDFQVKIRGYRIELGEIEQALYRHEAIATASVIDATDGQGEKYLCGFVVANHPVEEATLKDYLAEELPAYMVPDHIVFLTELPLTANGKVDRRALPLPSMSADSNIPFVAASTESELQLLPIWQEILGRESIGIDDNFFQLGGNSLRAGIMQAMVQKRIGIKLALPLIFQYPTIRQLAEQLLGSERSEFTAIPVAVQADNYPLSSEQQAMFSLAQLGDVGTAYNISIAYELIGKVDWQLLQRAVQQTIARHEILRTVFFIDGETPRQRVLAAEEINWQLDILPAQANESIDEIANRYIRSFDLAVAPLLRMAVVSLADDKSWLIVDMHHIVGDGSSLAIFWQEINAIYSGSEEATPRLQYKDYAVWQRDNKASLQKQEQYWLEKMSGDLPQLNIPLDYPRPDQQQFAGSRHYFTVSAVLNESLKKLAGQQGVSLYMVLMTAFKALLYRYSGQNDLLVGTVSSGRTHADCQDMLGIFVNTLVMRSQPNGKLPFSEYLQQVSATILAATDNQDFQFTSLLEKLAIKRDISRNPLFDVSLVLQNTDSVDVCLPGVDSKILNIAGYQAQLDLTLELEEQSDGTINGVAEYATSLFKEATIIRMVEHWQNILRDVAICPDKELKDIVMLSSEERQKLLLDYNATALALPAANSLPAWLRRVAGDFADKIALVYKEQSWTYRQLDEATDKWAKVLMMNGVQRESIVAIMVERSADIVFAEWAVLKAGAAFLPIDTKYPLERINYLLADSQAVVLLTQSQLMEKEIEFSGVRLAIDKPQQYWAEIGETSLAMPELTESSLAYMIYTSGSTGKPKGVMLEHGNLINLCAWVQSYHKVDSRDKAAAYSGFGFDASLWEMFPFILCGAELHIISEDLKLSLNDLHEYFNNNGVSITNLPTQLCEQYNDMFSDSSLRVLVTGGDKLRMFTPRNYKLVNEYGPTEYTISATAYTVECLQDNIPIGKPLANTWAYVLGKDDELLPAGVPGELCLAGRQLARGYWQRPDLTAEKFVDNPYSNGTENEKMYRSGDLVRWNQNGELEFLGRVDQQVKIRGYRIELGEIEQQLLTHPAIKDAVVLAVGSSNPYLCAWYTVRQAVQAEELAIHLRNELPEYMVPQAWQELAAIPLTANGKVDNRALPLPDVSNSPAASVYQPPENSIESDIAAIWQEVLRVDRIGRNDNFFQSGGDSIKAIQVMARLKRCNLKGEVRWLFKNPRLADFALTVEPLQMVQIEQPVSGEVPLTPIQHWFFTQDIKKRQHWNQSTVISCRHTLSEQSVQQALQKLTEHHDALRMIFEFSGSAVRQYNNPVGTENRCKLFCWQSDCSDEQQLKTIIDEQAAKAQVSLDLENGPLLAASWLTTPIGDFVTLVIHHLVVDGVSWPIIVEDFSSLCQNPQAQLPARTTSFKTFAEKLQQYANSNRLLKECDYWREVDKRQLLSLPAMTDKPDNNTLSALHSCRRTLPAETSEALFKQVNTAYNTDITEVLLTGFAAALGDLLAVAEGEFAVTVETHGRQDIGLGVDSERTVGWFTAAYPLVLSTKAKVDIGELLQECKERVRRVPSYGIGYDVLHYLTPDEKKGGAWPRLNSQIEFNYLGDVDGGTADGEFAIFASEAGGDIAADTENTYLLYATLLTSGGCLTINLDYNPQILMPTTIEALADKYLSYLQEIIQHCKNRPTQTTPADYGERQLGLAQLKQLQEQYQYNIEDIYALTPLQAGMMFAGMSDNSAYIEQAVYRVQGQINKAAFTANWQRVINKYAILRTAFAACGNSGWRQVVLKNIDARANLLWQKLDDTSEDSIATTRQAICQQQNEQGFDFAEASLLRLVMLECGQDEWQAILTIHHMLIDGWSIGLLQQELFDGYFMPQADFVTERAIPFRRFTDWLGEQDEQAANEFWQQYLLGADEQTVVPYSNNSTAALQLKDNIQVWDKDFSQQLHKLAKNQQVTLGTVLQALWSIMLMRYNNRADVIFGYVDSGRRPEIADIEKIIGLTVNTVPVRVTCQDDASFADLLADIQKGMLAIAEHNWLPLYEIQRQSELGNKLINNLVAFENVPDSAADEADNGFKVEEIDGSDNVGYDFSVTIVPGQQIIVRLTYDANKYSDEFVAMVAEHWQVLAKQVISQPEIKVHGLSIIAEEHKAQALLAVQGEMRDYGRGTILSMLDKQVVRTPEKAAVIGKDRRWSFAELAAASSNLARQLRAWGLRDEQPVVVMVSRSSQVTIAALAIMQAGGAYLPIDAAYPQARIDYILEDSTAGILLCERTLAAKVAAFNGHTIFLDELDFNSLAALNGKLPAIRPEQLAYIIYTSGSTGNPKGVMIEHRSLYNLTNWLAEYYQLTDNDVMAAYSGFAFDAAVWELFPFLACGVTVHVISEDIRLSVAEISRYFTDNNVTISDLPTQFCEYFMAEGNAPSLRSLTTGGDKLRKFNQPHYQLVNEYGPTEFTVSATAFRVDKYYENIPIGKPLSNSYAYITDRWGNLQPDGLPGELCLAGVQIARGYWRRPDLTAEKFISNPFAQSLHNCRLYKSGDLVRRRVDGNIEFLGRIDQQVKIRGYRIELAEIEQQLLTCDGVSDAVVVVNKDNSGESYLVAYYVGNATEEETKRQLHNRVAAYMVPAAIVKIAAIPTNANGKVDKRALPAVTLAATTEYIAPRNDWEERLATVWQDILGLASVGVNDNFFKIGGHSLKLAALATAIEREFAVKLSFAQLFNYQTIIEQAEFLLQAVHAPTVAPITAVEAREYYPLSPAQNRMYILESMEDVGTAYNIVMPLLITGELNKERLGRSLEKMIERHESLRSYFTLQNGEPVQRIADRIKLKRVLRESSDDSPEAIAALVENFGQRFALDQPPLVKVEMVRFSKSKHLLLLAFHHIIFDGVSSDIFMRELWSLYDNQTLPEITLHYRDFAVWQNDWLDTAAAKQKQYWLETLAGDLPQLALPLDYARPPLKSFSGDVYSWQLDSELSTALKRLAAENNCTMFAVFLSAFFVLLSRYSQQDDIIVGTPTMGRSHSELQDMIGMFVSSLAIRCYPMADKTFQQFLQEVSQQAIAAVDNQEYPLENILRDLAIKRDASRNPLFDVMISYGHEGEDYTFKGLQVTQLPPEDKVAQLDLTLEVLETGDSFALMWEYCDKLFKAATVERMSRHLCEILKAIVVDSQQPLATINLLDKEEKKQLLKTFNDTRLSYPRQQTVIETFKQQVSKHPQKLAAVDAKTAYSFSQLDKLTDKLATALIRAGVQHEQIVAVMVNRSVDIMVAGLAALKAGAGFVPIDPGYPPERIAYMLSDSQAAALLTHNALREKAADYSGNIICLDDEMAIWRQGEADEAALQAVAVRAKASDLAYIIYTSGSTGQPKGVMIEQRNLLNLCAWVQHYHQIAERDNSATYSGFGFDASVWEMYPFLLYGNTVHVIADELRLSPLALNDYLEANNITIINLPTQFCEQFIELVDNKSLRTVVTGGDKLRSYQQRNFRLVNEYGPTEYTVSATAFVVDGQYDNIPIGKPLANSWAYIIDKHNNLQPIGVPGELCLAGEQMARGYWQRPELTAEKFITNPYSCCEYDKRLYKTGDLARWRADGNIEFLGRIDSQVKIRGYRIELGEIEQQLLALDIVKDAYVGDFVGENGERYLAAYVVGMAGGLEEAVLRQELAKVLPDYMIPSCFLFVDNIPLTANGKIDKRALPQPQLAGTVASGERVIPQNAIQQAIANVWQQVLGNSEFGITDNFFNLGGNSIKAISVVAKLSTQFKITINDIFQHQTIAELAIVVKPTGNNLLAGLERLKQSLLEDDEQQVESEPPEIVEQRRQYMVDNKKWQQYKPQAASKWRAVLVTGATGFLGAHLLHELTEVSNCHIFTIVRANSDEQATERLQAKLVYYFGNEYWQKIKTEQRLTVLTGDLASENLGLPQHEYDVLRAQVDCVFHSAANVRHFGHYEEFQRANVTAVAEVSRFAGANIPLQHISTISIAEGQVADGAYVLFGEDDLDCGQQHENYYLDSKLAAEKLLAAARQQGGKINIFRVGNIVASRTTGIAQENIEENAFYAKLKAFVNIGAVPEDFSIEEFSYVDYLAKAIVLVARQDELAGRNFHLLNPNVVEMANLLSDERSQLAIDALPMPDFVDRLITGFDRPGFRVPIENLLTHMDLLAEVDESGGVTVVSERSDIILQRLGFNWPQATPSDLQNMIDIALRDREEFFAQVPILRGVESLYNYLARQASMQVFANRKDIVWEGEANDKFYLLWDGFASISRRSAGGWSGTIGMLKQGDAVGIDSVLGSEKATCTVEAEFADILVLALPADLLSKLLLEHPQLALNWLRLLQKHNEQYSRLLVNLS